MALQVSLWRMEGNFEELSKHSAKANQNSSGGYMGDLVFNGGGSSYFFGGCTWSDIVFLQENMACGSATNSELAELTFSEHYFLILELGSQSAMSPSMEPKLESSVTGTGVCTPDEAVISFFYSNPPPLFRLDTPRDHHQQLPGLCSILIVPEFILNFRAIGCL